MLGSTDDQTHLLFGRVEASVPRPPPFQCILHRKGGKREDATPTPMDDGKTSAIHAVYTIFILTVILQQVAPTVTVPYFMWIPAFLVIYDQQYFFGTKGAPTTTRVQRLPYTLGRERIVVNL